MSSFNPQDHLYGVFSPRRAPAKEVLHLEITLRETAVRRVVSVPAHFTLADLHLVVQVAMGWSDAHLHAFVVGDRRYGDPEQQDPMIAGELPPVFDEGNQKLDAIFRKQRSITYEYDFGDAWKHQVTLLERKPAKSTAEHPLDHRAPRVIAAEHNCPPEDIGGTHGYEELLQVVARMPDDIDEGLRVLAERYDPHTFDVDYANELLHGAFIEGDAGARSRRETVIARAAEAHDELLQRQNPEYLVPRTIIPSPVKAAAKTLKSAATNAPEVAALSGFFCGLHAAPEVVSPSSWIPHLLDFPEGTDQPEFADQDQMQTALNPVLQAYNAIGEEMSRGTLPLPFSYTSENRQEVALAGSWATGFFTAFSLVDNIEPITSETRGARAITYLGFLHGRQAEILLEDPEYGEQYTVEEIRRIALDALPKNVSYLYARGKELTRGTTRDGARPGATPSAGGSAGAPGRQAPLGTPAAADEKPSTSSQHAPESRRKHRKRIEKARKKKKRK